MSDQLLGLQKGGPVDRGGSGGPSLASRLVRFGLIGGSGLAVNSAALALFTGLLGVHYLVGVVLATQCSTLWNFVLAERWVFHGDGAWRDAALRYLQFAVVNNGLLLLRAPMVVAMTERLGAHYLVSNLVTLGVLFAVRFVLADTWIWRRSSAAALGS